MPMKWSETLSRTFSVAQIKTTASAKEEVEKRVSIQDRVKVIRERKKTKKLVAKISRANS